MSFEIEAFNWIILSIYTDYSGKLSTAGDVLLGGTVLLSEGKEANYRVDIIVPSDEDP